VIGGTLARALGAAVHEMDVAARADGALIAAIGMSSSLRRCGRSMPMRTLDRSVGGMTAQTHAGLSAAALACNRVLCIASRAAFDAVSAALSCRSFTSLRLLVPSPAALLCIFRWHRPHSAWAQRARRVAWLLMPASSVPDDLDAARWTGKAA